MKLRPFTPRELAERWQCSDQHVYNLVRDGTLPAIRLGKLIRIPAQAVEAFECVSSNTAVNGVPSSLSTESDGVSLSETFPQPPKIIRLPSGRSLTLSDNSPNQGPRPSKPS